MHLDNPPVCSNYIAVTRADRLLSFFGVTRERDDPPVDTWPTGMAPFIRAAEPGSGNRPIVEDGIFGLLPAFAKELVYGRKTYNARSETVHQLPSFRESWRNGWRCIVPAEAVYEPYYVAADGKPERWAIFRPGAVPMGIAGIYRKWRHPDGREVFTFAMLTVNADDHPFYSRFQKPGEEKRMPIILHEDEYDEWLSRGVQDAAVFFKQYDGPLEGVASPLPARPPSAGSVRTARPRPAAPDSESEPPSPPEDAPPRQPDLF